MSRRREVLPHIGGPHPARDSIVAGLLVEKLGRLVVGRPLKDVVDREAGYRPRLWWATIGSGGVFGRGGGLVGISGDGIGFSGGPPGACSGGGAGGGDSGGVFGGIGIAVS